jgi:ATP-binding cassette subfamily B protein
VQAPFPPSADSFSVLFHSVQVKPRLASCRFCDDIAEFDGGAVVQRGTHDVLLAREGLYREKWYSQAQYYTKKNGGAE